MPIGSPEVTGKRHRAARIAAAGFLLSFAAAVAHTPAAAPASDSLWRPARPPHVLLPGEACTALLAAGDELWVGTSGAGIVRLGKGTQRRWRSPEEGLPAGRILAFAALSSRFFALIAPDLLAVLEGERWRRLAGPEGFVHAIESHRGRLWAATDRGLRILEGESWRLAGTVEDVVCMSSSGESQLLWVSAAGKVRQGEPGTASPQESTALSSPKIRAILSVPGGFVLARSGRLEFGELGRPSGTEAPPPLPIAQPAVSSLADAAGALIAGTWGDGLARLSNGAWQLLGKPGGLPSDQVNAVAATADYVAAATESGLALIPLHAAARLPSEPAAIELTAASLGPVPRVPVQEASLAPEAAGMNLSRPDPHPRQILRAEGLGGEMSPNARLGDVLFEDPTVLGPRAQALGISCGTCHPGGDANSRFFIPGLSSRPGTVDLTHRYFSAAADDSRIDPVDIPSLRGARLTAPYGKDGRTASLREFIRNVIVQEFAGAEPATRDLDALTAYVNEFEFLPVPLLEPSGRLAASAPPAALRGEQAFHLSRPGFGGRSCASCHDPSTQFTDRQPHDVGSGGWFDTPSLLGAARSAPYFHDGTRQSLSEAVQHFDRIFTLGLTDGESRDLVAYLEAIGDVDRPWADVRPPASEKKPQPSGSPVVGKEGTP